MAWIAMVAQAGLSVMGAQQQGAAEVQAANFEASQMEAAGDQAMAESSRKAFVGAKEGKKLVSNQRAAMAASGGTTTDVGATETLAETERRIDFNVLNEVYTGESKRKELRRSAALRRWEGREAQAGAMMKGLSGAVSSGGSAYSLSKGSK